MKHFRWSYCASLALALALFASLLFGNQAPNALAANPPQIGAAAKLPAGQPANPLTNPVHTTNPVGDWPTIQAGINASNPGGTVNVDAGTYVEQLDINKAITLHGAGQGSTIVQSPAVLATKFSTGSGPKKPIVFVHVANAVVQNLTVDGLGLGNSNNAMVGVAFYNAGGAIDHTTIVHVRNTPLDGVQAGVGIYAFIDDAMPRTLTVDHNTISDYQKNGMALNGTGLTANVTNNTVTGAGVTPLTAQNGIQIGFGGTGSIIGNVISGNFCTHSNPGVDDCLADPTSDPAADGAAAILLYAPSSPSITVANNLLNGDQFGVWAVAAPAVSIHDNTFLSGGKVGVAIQAGDGGETAQATTGAIDQNTFQAQQYGLIVMKYTTTNPAITGRNNHFMGNTTDGAWANAPTTLTNNWWNAVNGPSGAGSGSGDAVSTNITYNPFLTDPPAYAHIAPATPITISVGTTVTLDLLVNAGTQGVVAQQSYLTFPTGLLQNVNANTGAPSSTVSADPTSFDTVLQNQVCNGPGACTFGNLTADAGTIAFASGTITQSVASGDFRVAQVTFAANTVGDATLHWQFYPPDPANRNSKINNAANDVVSDRTLYQDYVIHIVHPQFTGHVIWEGRPAQPDPLQVLPINLTLTYSGTDYHFNGLTTDANGNFSVDVNDLPSGPYTWRVKGPQYLSTSGSVALNRAVNTTAEMGLQPAGDANNDNLVDVTDFSILRASFGYAYPDPNFDARADFTGDQLVDITDFSLLRGNFGRLGNGPARQAGKQTGGSAVLELRPQGKGPANGGTVHVGDRFVLELWVNAQPGTSVVGQQGYLTFPTGQLQLGNPTQLNPVAGALRLVTPDSSVLDLALQNAICNGPASCVAGGMKIPAGSLAFASASLNATGSGAFRVGQVVVQATAPGTARLHWQFSPPDSATRNSKIVSENGVTVSQPAQFVDYVLNILPAGK